ncbi:MAG: NAD-dependent DNA ligase LigA [Bacteroidales bacterium]|jgi:DNA ligase (NAD+)|nr:NAD-dependent DNA ligase LigA [Bacteroidales bacterium]
MTEQEAKVRIRQLVDDLNRHSYLYYVLDSPVISDYDFDILLKELESLEAQYPQFVFPDSPTARVGGEPVKNFMTVVHKVPMFSLGNTYSREEIADFDRRVREFVGGGGGFADGAGYGGGSGSGLADGAGYGDGSGSGFADGAGYGGGSGSGLADGAGYGDGSGSGSGSGFADGTGYGGGNIPFNYVCELKYDGLSISLEYNNGLLTRAVTRGDGTKGDDVTSNVRTIKSIPLKLQGSGYPQHFTIRGEVVMPHSSFKMLNAQREEIGLEKFANPRNAASGSLKLQDPKQVAERSLDCFLYFLISDEIAEPLHENRLKMAAQWGFKTGNYYRVCNNLQEIYDYIDYWDIQRKALPFDTDGVVIKVNQTNLWSSIGVTAKFPRWAIAYKFKAERVETKIMSVDFQVGRTGRITPVANLCPVQLAGTTVQRATLNSEGFIRDLDVRIGDTVFVEKGGEVIPKIVGVNLEKRPLHTPPFRFIENCPECGTTLVKGDDEEIHFCPNSAKCPPQVKGLLSHFVSRKAMDIFSLGDERIDLLYRNAGVRNVADLYDLKFDDLFMLGSDSGLFSAPAEVVSADGAVADGAVSADGVFADGAVADGVMSAADGAVADGAVSAANGATADEVMSAADGAVADGVMSAANGMFADGAVVDGVTSAANGMFADGAVADDGMSANGAVADGVMSAADGAVSAVTEMSAAPTPAKTSSAAAGLATTPVDLFSALSSPSSTVPEKKQSVLKEKSVENILEGINNSKKVPFERVLYAIGIRYVGEVTAKHLARHFSSMDNLQKATIEELIDVEEVGEIVAKSIFDFFASAENTTIIERLKSHGLQMETTAKIIGGVLSGTTWVVSGVFTVSRDEIKSMIEQNGGKISSSISSKTNYLLAGENVGPEKKKKAEALEIKMVSEQEFREMIRN